MIVKEAMICDFGIGQHQDVEALPNTASLEESEPMRLAKLFNQLLKVASLAASVILSGCEDSSKPSVSGSNTEVTVHGTIKYKGKPLTQGEISFNPANTSRRDAKSVSAAIGSDGSYTVKTLLGENTVSFNLPTIAKNDLALAAASYVYDAPSGDSTYDIDLSAPK